MPNLTVIRRSNAVALYQVFLQHRIAAGEAPKGLDQAFAAEVQISPSMWSQIKSSRPISDKLARQIEHHTRQAEGWMDVDRRDATEPDLAEERLVAAVRSVWRNANAREKRELVRLFSKAKKPSE